jgi:seryl-tRNA synthetase
MHDIRWIREHKEAFDRTLRRRGLPPEADKLIALDEQRRSAIQHYEQAQARRNAVSKEIGQAKARKDEATAEKLMAEMFEFKTTVPKLQEKVREAEEALKKAIEVIPNVPADDVPDGTDPSGNVERHRFGAKREYSFTPKQHFELGEALGMMDFETAAKLSGARFVVLTGGLARLERALAQFMLDVHTQEHGYTEVNPPLIVNEQTMYGTAQLPKFQDDQFPVPIPALRAATQKIEITKDKNRFTVVAELASGGPLAFDIEQPGLMTEIGPGEIRMNTRRWLIPTAEVPLTNLVRESIVEEDKLPLRYTACTPCFRAEAGAAGKDTRGMIRQHQFTKVELVSITTPEQSKDEHERMLSCAEEVLRRLDLHYRVVTLCTGDMGFAARKTYDIEVWLPGQGAYREISSCSNCGEFQARRMMARFRAKDGRPHFVHTLNGSGVAVGRALIAVLETYQEADGAIVVPEALAPYMGGVKKIEMRK